MTLVYLHGFRSSPGSVKATRFGAAIGVLPEPVRPRLHVPALSHRPAEAVGEVARWIDRELGTCAAAQLTLVGSSLGGYYATHLAERFGARAVLINPTVRPFEDLRAHLGVQLNMHTGEAFEVGQAHLAELAALRVDAITRPERYLLLVETGDEVLDYRAAVAHYGGAWQYVRGGGDHAFRDFEAQIPAILRFAGVRVP